MPSLTVTNRALDLGIRLYIGLCESLSITLGIKYLVEFPISDVWLSRRCE